MLKILTTKQELEHQCRRLQSDNVNLNKEIRQKESDLERYEFILRIREEENQKLKRKIQTDEKIERRKDAQIRAQKATIRDLEITTKILKGLVDRWTDGPDPDEI